MAYSRARRLAQLLNTDGSVAAARLPADVVDGTKIADDAIDSEHYTDGSIDTAHIADDAITAAKIVAGAVVADIGNDSIDSQHYIAGSIDNEHLADDAVNSDELAAGAVDTAHIADDQVTLAKMAGLTRGTIIYGNSSGNPTALAVGSSGQALTSDGTDVAWGSGGKTTEEIEDIVGAMVSGNTETRFTATYDDTNAKLDFVGQLEPIPVVRVIARSSMIDCTLNSSRDLVITGRAGNVSVVRAVLPVLAQPTVALR